MGFSHRHLTATEKLDAEEMRGKIFERDNFTCRICGKSIYQHGTPQLAHRIAQGKLQIKLYGEQVIYHSLNMWSVCDLKCNGAADITRNTEEREKLLDDIYKAIGEGIK